MISEKLMEISYLADKKSKGVITMAKEMRDRLVESMTKRFKELYKDGDWNFNEMLVGVADRLLDDGWIRPPMKLGQMCFKPWYSAWSDEVRQYRVSSITQKADGSFKMRLTDLVTKSVFEITPDKIGEKVFLTKEEAEQKLKEMRGGNDL
jgi:hypothetical protein